MDGGVLKYEEKKSSSIALGPSLVSHCLLSLLYNFDKQILLFSHKSYASLELLQDKLLHNKWPTKTLTGI